MVHTDANGLVDRVLPIDESIAEAWARLSVRGPLPLIDRLLAATVQVHGLTLVTRNVADVARTGVSLLNPLRREATSKSSIITEEA
jgi:predicted nucleic acid-binding protein